MELTKRCVNVGAFSPKIQLADPETNAKEICRLVEKYAYLDVIVFPELCITGYTCGDLFLQSFLIDAAKEAVKKVADYTKSLFEEQNEAPIVVIGAPVEKDGRLFNCAVFVQTGKILAYVPKAYLPNYNEFYERRWFSAADKELTGTHDGVCFGTDVLIKDESGTGLVMAADICEDLWMPIPPSAEAVKHGANLVVNLSASNEVVSKTEYRRSLVAMQSAKCVCGYVYASAGVDESTTDTVFSGHRIVACNGAVLDEKRYDADEPAVATIDVEKLENDRRRFGSFSDNTDKKEYRIVCARLSDKPDRKYLNAVDPYPFVPKDDDRRRERCREIFTIQSVGLSQRMAKTGIEKLVVGVSGGLDSTLALLAMVEAVKRLGIPASNIHGITMPGFGTTERTKGNSEKLMELLGVTSACISIVPSVEQHFKDIGHPADLYDLIYENSQARERTQILMDKANQVNGLVVGTGDLSELALGWCTYNADHMSMYAVNTGIPKTLVRYVVETVAKDYEDRYMREQNDNFRRIAEVLYDICDTPISPELLPTGENGEMIQKTEESIGKYDLHDFFLYHMLRNCFPPGKIFELAVLAFPNVSRKQIRDTLSVFYKRFFTQQFKRSCLPEGPKVGSVAVSPRGDLRMPSDASAALWLEEVANISCGEDADEK